MYVLWLFNGLFHCRCLVLSVYVLRFMTLGSKINSKFTNTSGLLTEQVSNNEIPLYHVSGKRIIIASRRDQGKAGGWGVLKGSLRRGEIPLYHVSGKRIGFPLGPKRGQPPATTPLTGWGTLKGSYYRGVPPRPS